jgi:hypothetical protein
MQHSTDLPALLLNSMAGRSLMRDAWLMLAESQKDKTFCTMMMSCIPPP